MLLGFLALVGIATALALAIVLPVMFVRDKIEARRRRSRRRSHGFEVLPPKAPRV